MEKEELEFAATLFNEDHAPVVNKKTTKIRSDVNDYRLDLLDIIKKDYPKEMGNFVKVTKKLDAAFDELEKLAKRL